MNKKLTLNTKALLAFILSIAAMRVGFAFGATPMSNFTPIGAMALFGGAYFTKKWQAFLLPLATLWLSDVVMNRFIFFHEWRFFYEGSGYVYGAFAMMVLAGSFLKKINITNVFVSMLVITFIHWIVSDIGVWLSSYSLYPKTWGGYITCLIAAIPYELNFLAGTVVYGALMFGTAEWMISRKIFTQPALAA